MSNPLSDLSTSERIESDLHQYIRHLSGGDFDDARRDLDRADEAAEEITAGPLQGHWQSIVSRLRSIINTLEGGQ